LLVHSGSFIFQVWKLHPSAASCLPQRLTPTMVLRP
jgi:hypothetical protein